MEPLQLTRSQLDAALHTDFPQRQASGGPTTYSCVQSLGIGYGVLSWGDDAAFLRSFGGNEWVWDSVLN